MIHFIKADFVDEQDVKKKLVIELTKINKLIVI